jgi:hypothetical protein
MAELAYSRCEECRPKDWQCGACQKLDVTVRKNMTAARKRERAATPIALFPKPSIASPSLNLPVNEGGAAPVVAAATTLPPVVAAATTLPPVVAAATTHVCGSNPLHHNPGPLALSSDTANLLRSDVHFYDVK